MSVVKVKFTDFVYIGYENIGTKDQFAVIGNSLDEVVNNLSVKIGDKITVAKYILENTQDIQLTLVKK